MTLTTLDRIRKARITIQRRNPFFAYLSLYLKLEEDINNILDCESMGVSSEGRLLYNKDFVDKLTDEELVGVLVHEILHLSLLHLLRLGKREPMVWNLACDICVNSIVKENNLTLPNGGIIPDYNNEITLFGIKIINCNKKPAEEIYNELKPLLKNKQFQDFLNNYYKSGNGFDKHIIGKIGKDGKVEELTEDEVRDLGKDWANKSKEAYVTSKMRGNVPKGIERLVEDLHKEKINWRAILLKYIQRSIPYDYTYSKPSKKSISAGFYMPSVKKENIDVVVAVDTSGSIGNKELQDFLSEIIGISKAYFGRVKMRLLTHDTKVWDDLIISNGNITKIKELNIRGGGGTSHKEVLKYVQENIPNNRLLVCFTDGDSDLQEIELTEYNYDKLFIISENGNDNQIKNKGVGIINLGEGNG